MVQRDMSNRGAEMKPLEDHPPEWHAKRREVIGGSDTNKIMAGEWRDLWAVKTGRKKGDDLSNVLAVQMGSWTEALNRAWFEKQTGLTVKTVDDHLVHGTVDYMGGNLDGVIDVLGQPEVFEAKHTNAGMNVDKAVSRYYAQLQHLMILIGADTAYLSCFFGNSKWDHATVKFDREYAEVLLEWEAEFWGYVQRDEEPEDREGFGVKIDTSTLKKVDMNGNNEWGSAADAYLKTIVPAQDHEDAKKELKALVAAAVGEAHGHGIRIKRSTNSSLRIYQEK